MAVNITRSGIERLELVDVDGDRLTAAIADDVVQFTAHRLNGEHVVAVNAEPGEVRELAAALSELADQLDPDS